MSLVRSILASSRRAVAATTVRPLAPVAVPAVAATTTRVRAFAAHPPTAPSSTELNSFNSANWDHHAWEQRDVTSGDPTNRTFTYMVLGGGRFLYASLGRATVLKALSYWTPAADVMAMAALEVDITKISEGTALTVIWRGKPVFIRHRTPLEIKKAQDDDNSSDLKDPQKDKDRVKDDKWLVVMGICTHFGCVPMNGQGNYGGWFCPCHGSHYDTSGRIRRGPAPLNLEVPEYSFLTPGKLLLGKND